MKQQPMAIEMTGLRVVRGRRVVLPAIDLRLAAGQVIGLLGSGRPARARAP